MVDIDLLARADVQIKKRLLHLKEEYAQMVRDALVPVVDALGLRHWRFTAESNNRLYLHESKMRLLAAEVSDDSIDNWIKSKRLEALQSMDVSGREIDFYYKDVLAKLCEEFRFVLASYTRLGVNQFGYEDLVADDESMLRIEQLGKKIIVTGRAINCDMFDWVRRAWSEHENELRNNQADC